MSPAGRARRVRRAARPATHHAKEDGMGLEIGALRRAGTLGKRATGAMRLVGGDGAATGGARRNAISACVEAAAGVLLVTAIGLALPGHWGLLDIQPHPLW